MAWLGLALGTAALAPVPVLAADPAPAPSASDTLRLTLEDALGIAWDRNRPLRLSRLGVEQAAAELREARAARRPQLDVDAGFTREVVSVNPFAGAPATDLLGDGVPTEWLLWNERARTDPEVDEDPIPLPEFQDRQEEAFDRAGVTLDPVDNPFAVPNRFQAGVSLQQSLWDPGATARVRALRRGGRAVAAGSRRQWAATVDSTRQAYLGALLAREEADVVARSVERSRDAVEEAARRVEEGTAPISERISNEVELAGLEADLVGARSREKLTRDRLKATLGIPLAEPVLLLDTLAVEDAFALADTPLDDLLAEARDARPDVEEARLALEAEEARVDAMEAAYRPSVHAFVNLTSQGSLPDDRTRVITDPLMPFQVETERPGVLSGRFWELGADLGVQLRWNVFGGGALRAQAEGARVGVREAELQLEEREALMELEVETALEELRSARDRARIHEENVHLARRNLEVAEARVRQGVGIPLERREASEQLDRSLLGLLQAKHDYLAARSRLGTAVGRLPLDVSGEGGTP